MIKDMKQYSTDEVMVMLAEKYKAPEYALLQEVANGTGGNKSRACDGLAMSLWPSRGLHLIGFEVKVSRQDWMKEKDDPAKADAIACYCDFWYLVISARGIVQNGELPMTWGLIAPRGNKLVIEKEAQQLEPIPIDRKFLAAILRKSSEGGRRQIEIELARARERAFKEGRELGKHHAEYEMSSLKSKCESLEKAIVDFENVSGVKIDRWHNKQIGEAVRYVLAGNIDGMKNKLGEIRRVAQNILTTVDSLD